MTDIHLRFTSSTGSMKTFMDDTKHGVFAIRAPGRPNPIGLSIEKIEGNILTGQGNRYS